MSHIDEQSGRQLLRLARRAIEAHLAGDAPPVTSDESLLSLEPTGVFVTLRKAGRLRGCIGTFQPAGDLPTTVAAMAIAATQDPRFVTMPLSLSETADVRIELSILSPLRRIADPLDFELGRHGVHIRWGGATGCFLPSVAADQGWDRERFLSECCLQKAGADADVWRDPQAVVSVFTVYKLAEQ